MISVVVCVYNGLPYIKDCFSAILSTNSRLLSEVIVIDDCSDAETKNYLDTICASDSRITMKTNKVNLGYTRSANLGYLTAGNELVLLLNSDTYFNEFSLQQLVIAMNNESNFAVLGPLSNSASWQSIPQHYNENLRNWKHNNLDDLSSISFIEKILYKHFGDMVIRVPILNGFCLLIRKRFVSGALFDELAFPRGYGEENDLCIRLHLENFRVGVVPSSFFYHHKTKSFTFLERSDLSKQAGTRLRQKHGSDFVKSFTSQVNYQPLREAVNKIRSEIVPFFND